MGDELEFLNVGQISRSVKDIKQSEEWYRDVLGLLHLYTFDKLSFFDCGGTRLMLNQSEELQSAESVIYLRVSNIEGTYEALQAKGVKFINAPHMIHRHDDGTEEWMAFFEDPEGRPLAVMSSVSP